MGMKITCSKASGGKGRGLMRYRGGTRTQHRHLGGQQQQVGAHGRGLRCKAVQLHGSACSLPPVQLTRCCCCLP